ncbi:MAG: hypothetical protein AAB873_02445 [Patescibacteria group bacterium]
MFESRSKKIFIENTEETMDFLQYWADEFEKQQIEKPLIEKRKNGGYLIQDIRYPDPEYPGPFLSINKDGSIYSSHPKEVVEEIILELKSRINSQLI